MFFVKLEVFHFQTPHTQTLCAQGVAPLMDSRRLGSLRLPPKTEGGSFLWGDAQNFTLFLKREIGCTFAFSKRFRAKCKALSEIRLKWAQAAWIVITETHPPKVLYKHFNFSCLFITCPLKKKQNKKNISVTAWCFTNWANKAFTGMQTRKIRASRQAEVDLNNMFIFNMISLYYFYIKCDFGLKLLPA